MPTVPFADALARTEKNWLAKLPIHRTADITPIARLNKLIAAIDSILDFARANALRFLNSEELERLSALDERFGSLCGVAGPPIGNVPEWLQRTRAKKRDPFGYAFIPQLRRPRASPRDDSDATLSDVRLNPIPEWEHAMRRLRAAAERLREQGGVAGRGPDGRRTREGMAEVIDRGGRVGYDGPEGYKVIIEKDDLPSEEELSLQRVGPPGPNTPDGYVAWCEDHIRKLESIVARWPESVRRGPDGVPWGAACASDFVRKAGSLAFALNAKAAVAAGGLIEECVEWNDRSPVEAIRKLGACVEWGRSLSGVKPTDAQPLPSGPPAGARRRTGHRAEGAASRGDRATPAQPDGSANIPAEQVTGESGSQADRREQLQKLTPTVRKAYLAFVYAESKAEKRLDDREAYNLLKEEGIPENAGDLAELEDYELPVFPTWARYLGRARKALGEQKYQRRRGRPHGGSVVEEGQIERQADDE